MKNNYIFIVLLVLIGLLNQFSCKKILSSNKKQSVSENFINDVNKLKDPQSYETGYIYNFDSLRTLQRIVEFPGFSEGFDQFVSYLSQDEPNFALYKDAQFQKIILILYLPEKVGLQRKMQYKNHLQSMSSVQYIDYTIVEGTIDALIERYQQYIQQLS